MFRFICKIQLSVCVFEILFRGVTCKHKHTHSCQGLCTMVFSVIEYTCRYYCLFSTNKTTTWLEGIVKMPITKITVFSIFFSFGNKHIHVQFWNAISLLWSAHELHMKGESWIVGWWLLSSIELSLRATYIKELEVWLKALLMMAWK